MTSPCRWSFVLLLGCAAAAPASLGCSSNSSSASAGGSAGAATEAGSSGASDQGGDGGDAGSSLLGNGGSAVGGEAGVPSFGGIAGTFVGGSSGAANGGGGSSGAPLCSGLPATAACTTTSTDGFVTCDESTGSSFANAQERAETQSLCVGRIGTFTTACSTRGVYGRCIRECGQADEAITYYYDSLAGDAGKSTCDHEGSTWDGP